GCSTAAEEYVRLPAQLAGREVSGVVVTPPPCHSPRRRTRHGVWPRGTRAPGGGPVAGAGRRPWGSPHPRSGASRALAKRTKRWDRDMTTSAYPRTATQRSRRPSSAPAPDDPGRLPRGGLAAFWALAFGLSWTSWGAAWLLGGDLADPAVLALYAL